MSFLFEVLLIVFLLLVNGVFAMSEIAVVSARKSRLQHRAEEGSHGARRALELAEEPSRFLATVQVGITLVGILAGAFGGARLAEPLAASLMRVPALAPYAEAAAFALVVLAITYLSLVIGELVPKRIGLNSPEKIAATVAGPMMMLSRVARPMVALLTGSTEALVRLMGLRKSDEPPVTEAEVSGLIEQGTRAGVFTEEEQELVERVFWLADQRVVSVMTPRVDVVWLDAQDPSETHRDLILANPFDHFPLCDGSLDRVVGMVSVRDLWSAAAQASGEPATAASVAREPLVVPASARALQVLEMMRASGQGVALIVDEYGGTDGLVTLRDILEELVGDFRPAVGGEDPEVVERDDGSLLVDGSVLMDELRDVLDLDERRGDDRHDYRTVGGFVASRLGRIPRSGDRVESDEFTVEVVDMDRHRVDKVLVTRARGEAEEED